MAERDNSPRRDPAPAGPRPQVGKGGGGQGGKLGNRGGVGGVGEGVGLGKPGHPREHEGGMWSVGVYRGAQHSIGTYGTQGGCSGQQR